MFVESKYFQWSVSQVEMEAMTESCLKPDESLLAHVNRNQESSPDINSPPVDIPKPGLPQHLAVTMTLRKGGKFSLLSFSWSE